MTTTGSNLVALGTLGGLNDANTSIQKTLARIATARRVNSAADDAASLAIGSALEAENRSVSQAMRNINDGRALAETADTVHANVGDMLSRMRELAVQSSSGTLNDGQRQFLQDEFAALSAEIDRVAGGTEFNGIQLTDGSTPAVDVQAGPGSANSQVSVPLGDLQIGALGLGGASVDSAANAQAALDAIDAAIDQVSAGRSSLGASMNALDSAFAFAEGQQLALSRSASSMLDADLALESAQLATHEIRQQTSVAVQVQANRVQTAVSGLL